MYDSAVRRHLDAKMIIKALRRSLERLDAPIHLVAAVGSYDDTLTDREVLAAIEAFNAQIDLE